ncbi:hypothetical protein H8959_002057 [Pygathrix nigripes]
MRLPPEAALRCSGPLIPICSHLSPACFPEERKEAGEEVRRGQARTGRKSASGCEGAQGRGGGSDWSHRGSQVTPGLDIPPLMSVQQGAAPASPAAAVCVDGGREALAHVP